MRMMMMVAVMVMMLMMISLMMMVMMISLMMMRMPSNNHHHRTLRRFTHFLERNHDLSDFEEYYAKNSSSRTRVDMSHVAFYSGSIGMYCILSIILIIVIIVVIVIIIIFQRERSGRCVRFV